MNKGTGFWTEENVEHLRHWWEVSGYTCGRIKEEFGRLGCIVTTNMVIGKVHRLKLRAPEWKAEKIRKRQAEICKVQWAMRPKPERQDIIMGKKYNPRRPPEVKVSLANGKPVGDQATSIHGLTDTKCRAIIGYIDGKLEGAVYCGEKTVRMTDRYGHSVDSSWCPEHYSRYITKSKPAKNQAYRQGSRR